MRFRILMDDNKDTIGVGVVGMVAAFATTSNLLEMIMTAGLVAAASFLGGYLMKKIVLLVEGLIAKYRKAKTNN